MGYRRCRDKKKGWRIWVIRGIPLFFFYSGYEAGGKALGRIEKQTSTPSRS